MSRANEKMHSPIDASWDWSYAIGQEKIGDLYAKAKRDQWNADVAIDWSTPVDPGGKILDGERMAFLQLGFFKRLDKKKLEIFNAHYSAWILSQLLHGEQGALMVAGELVACAPDHEAKLYVGSQAMDEARHVEVFARYIRRLDKIYPPQPTLKSILKDIIETPYWQAKMVGMQVILEGLALGTFINVRAATGCELLRSLLGYVTKDEARHVAFGNVYLTTEVARMHPDERAAVEDFACAATQKTVAMRRGPEGMAGLDDVLVDSDLDPAEFWSPPAGARWCSAARASAPRAVRKLGRPGIRGTSQWWRPLARGRPATIVARRETSEAGRPIPISGPSDGRLDPSAAAAGHRVPAGREPGAPRTPRHGAPAVHGRRAERNHQGLDNVSPLPLGQPGKGAIRRHERLGGVLRHYRRDAA